MSSPVPAGWFADPSGAAPYRWWDGQNWSEHTSAGPSAVEQSSPEADPQTGPQASVTPGTDAPHGTRQQGGPQPYGGPAGGQQPIGGQPYRQQLYGQQGHGQQGHVNQPCGGQPAAPSRFGTSARPANPGNQFAYVTFGVLALYVVLAFFVHVVFFGILPVLMAVRSRSAREPLAPVAIGAAAVAVLLAIVLLAA